MPAVSSIMARRSSGVEVRIFSIRPCSITLCPLNPMPASIRISLISLSLLGTLLIRYSLSPERKRRLVISISEYSEIEITRRLFRSGESEYLINRVPSRLKDIKEILIDAGIGFKGHSVIEQGRIEKILTSTPEDRRAIIEDTAGIMKYKFRKTEALRKLEATQHNLLRVRDIISEVKRQINSLDRQVRKAREYQELAGQIKEQDISLQALKYTSLDSTLKGLLQREETLKDEEMRAQSDLLSIEAKTEEIRTLIVGAEKDLSHLRQALFDLDREISGNENQLILIENQTAHHREEGVRLITEISKLREDLASFLATP